MNILLENNIIDLMNSFVKTTKINDEMLNKGNNIEETIECNIQKQIKKDIFERWDRLGLK